MASRFPMPVPPFPLLAMADSERDRLEYLAHRLVHNAIDDYDAHRQAGGKVDARTWKLVRTCDHLAMYKRTQPSVLHQPAQARQPATPIRSRGESVSVVDNSIAQGRPRQKMPVLLQVGSIQGSLNEVMYGAVAVDGPTMMLKAAYTENTLLDAETLCQLRGPSASHPFRFLGVKWVVKGTPHAALSPIVRPRDLVFIEATGILTREDNNERIGYHLMHSVSVPGYGPLDDKKIARAQISSCILYLETPESPGGVDVFMKARFDPNGNVSESVATHSVALTLMYGAKASVCAQNKKLSWLIRSSPDSSARQRPARSMSMTRQRSCPICAKNFKLFSGTAECEMCSTVICHACCVKKKLGFAKTGSKKIILHPVAFCTSCLTHARRLDDFDAARQEVLAGFGVDATSAATNRSTPSVHNCRRRDLQKMKTPPPLPPSIPKAKAPKFSKRPHSERMTARAVATSPRARQRVNTWGVGDVEPPSATRRWDELERQVAASGLVEPIDEMEEISEIKIHESSLIKVVDHRVSFQAPPRERETGTQEDFMARIIAMRNAAEDAYMTTRKTAQAQFEQLTRPHNNRSVRFSHDPEAHAVR